MKNHIQKLRYKFFGKQIQKAMEMSERSGREAAEYIYNAKLRDLELKYEANETLANKKLANLKYTVNPDDVMTASKDRMGNTQLIFLGNEQLSQQEIINLKNEVRLLQDTRLWKIINDTLKSQAHDIMFTKSKTYDDMVAGKMMIYNLSVIENIVKTIEKFDLKK